MMATGISKKGMERLMEFSKELTESSDIAVIEPIIFVGLNAKHTKIMRADFAARYPSIKAATIIEISVAAGMSDIYKRLSGLSQGWVYSEVAWDEFPDKVFSRLGKHAHLDPEWILAGRDARSHADLYYQLITGAPAFTGTIRSTYQMLGHLVWYMMMMSPSDLFSDQMRWLGWAKDKMDDLDHHVKASLVAVSAGDHIGLALDAHAPLVLVSETPAIPFGVPARGSTAEYIERDSIAHKMNEIDQVIGIFSDHGPFTAERHEVRMRRLNELLVAERFYKELIDSLEHIKELEAKLEEQAMSPAYHLEYRAEHFIGEPITKKFPPGPFTSSF